MNVRIFWVCVMECMCAQTRPRFILSSERVLWGNGVRTHVNSKGKIPSTVKLILRWGWNPPHCIQKDSEPNTLLTELFRPPFMICLWGCWCAEPCHQQISNSGQELGITVWLSPLMLLLERFKSQESRNNLEAVMKHSPFRTEQELKAELRTLSKTRSGTGTKIVIYNLRRWLDYWITTWLLSATWDSDWIIE